MSEAFDEEIFNSLKQDVRGVIRGAIEGVSSPRKRVMDLGCGVGRYLPLLSGQFGEVHATDWSPGCVRHASQVAKRLPNVRVALPKSYGGPEWTGRFGVVTAINVLFDPRERRRVALLSEIRRLLTPRGSLVLVVPSLEAIVYADAVRRTCAPRRPSLYEFAIPASKRDPGILLIEGVPYKHWVGEELQLVLRNAGFRPGPLARVEYKWETEVVAPPRPRELAPPWDWLVVARRA
ncbi:MAG: class I SAM-dependent methyltransferase [Gemmatimonadaceae bacterium]